jgi:hypothetical protein
MTWLRDDRADHRRDRFDDPHIIPVAVSAKEGLHLACTSRCRHQGLANSGDTCARYAAAQRTTIVSGLTTPTSVEVGPDGARCVSNRGILPATGQVIRFAVQID